MNSGISTSTTAELAVRPAMTTLPNVAGWSGFTVKTGKALCFTRSTIASRSTVA
jgi:hypothetical protein